jgi:hypothetical protein
VTFYQQTFFNSSPLSHNKKKEEVKLYVSDTIARVINNWKRRREAPGTEKIVSKKALERKTIEFV